MAFDKNDAADKKILADAIAEALSEAETEHEIAIAGLKKKNTDLILKNKALAKGEGTDLEELARLETQLDDTKKALRVAEKAAKDAAKERDAFKLEAETEAGQSRKLLVDQGLTSALLENKVALQFLPAVKKLLADRVVVKADGETRTAEVDGKPLGEFVKAFALSDEGKHYVVAPANGGANAPGGKAPPANHADIMKLPPVERMNAARAAQK